MSKEQKSTLQKLKLLYKAQEAVIGIFNNFFSFASEVKYKAINVNNVNDININNVFRSYLHVSKYLLLNKLFKDY